MSDFPDNEHLNRAAEHLQAQRWQEALREADLALETEPDLLDALLYRGIALSRLGAYETSKEAFQRAIAVAPYNAKAHYNLAVHYHANAQLDAARASLQEALRIDPKYQEAAALSRQLASEAPAEEPTPTEPTPTEAAREPQRPYGSGTYSQDPTKPTGWGYSQPRPDQIPAIGTMGRWWTGFAWLVALLSFPATLVAWAYLLPLALTSQGDPNKLQSLVQKEMTSNPVFALVFISVMALGFAAILWVVVDLFNRRGPWSWLIGAALFGVAGHLCCFSCGMPYIFLPLYLLLRRN